MTNRHEVGPLADQNLVTYIDSQHSHILVYEKQEKNFRGISLQKCGKKTVKYASKDPTELLGQP